MIKWDRVVHALSAGSHRLVLIALRGEEYIHPCSADSDERDWAIPLHRAYLPLLGDTDLVAWNQARRDALPDNSLPYEGQTC